ncbi:hypothetical protein M0R45_026424 [Rubus argutus]|uniref:Uncharacterized protein n=1 Tax=Rubus argutus TaxID=59490 RepID=A0AAW1WY40_RUBAR
MELKLAATASAASSVLSHFSPRSSTVDHPLRSDSICRCQAHKPTGFPKSFPINSAHPRRRTSLLATPPLKFTEPCSHRDVDIASLDPVVFSLSQPCRRRPQGHLCAVTSSTNHLRCAPALVCDPSPCPATETLPRRIKPAASTARLRLQPSQRRSQSAIDSCSSKSPVQSP